MFWDKSKNVLAGVIGVGPVMACRRPGRQWRQLIHQSSRRWRRWRRWCRSHPRRRCCRRWRRWRRWCRSRPRRRCCRRCRLRLPRRRCPRRRCCRRCRLRLPRRRRRGCACGACASGAFWRVRHRIIGGEPPKIGLKSGRLHQPRGDEEKYQGGAANGKFGIEQKQRRRP